MPKKKHSVKRRSEGEAALICELVKLALPPPNKTASDKAILEWVNHSFRTIGVSASPLLALGELEKWLPKWVSARQALDSLHAEIHALPPEFPNLPTFSLEEKQTRVKLLRDVDRAIFNFVDLDKGGLFSHPVVPARIKVGVVFADTEFFDRLALSVGRKVGPHGRIRRERLIKAAMMLDQGITWMEVYKRLLEAGEMEPIDDKEFYKFLQRHKLIPRKKQKSSKVTKGA